MRAIQAREDAAVASMRRVDAGTLDAYGKQLRDRGRSDVAAMSAQLQRRTDANLAARGRVLAAQSSAPSALHLPSAPAQSGSPGDVQAQYDALVKAPLPSAAGFASASRDLSQRFRALAQSDASDTQSVRSQIASLRHDREAARKKMIAQIMTQAQREAQKDGYSQVYASRQAPAGSADITAAVAADLRALNP